MEQNNYQNQKPIQPPFVPIRRRNKSKFLTFICALVPGAGQMYHGLLKRGLSIMLIFWGAIGISILLYTYAVLMILPVIWFYSFFDAVNRMNMPIDEMAMLHDEWLVKMDPVQHDSIARLFAKRQIWIGWGLTLIGLYALVSAAFERISYAFSSNMNEMVYQSLRYIINIIPVITVPVICIIIGVKLIIGTTKKSDNAD